MDKRQFDQTLKALGSSGSRRGAFGSLVAIGTALFGATGGSAADHKTRGHGGVRGERKRKKKAKRGPSGPAGPAGTPGLTGPIGPAGAPGEPLRLVTHTGVESGVLGANVGSEVESKAECGPASTPLNCGWFYLGAASAFTQTTTEVGPTFNAGLGSCTARLRRTGTVGNAGGQIAATAICTQ